MKTNPESSNLVSRKDLCPVCGKQQIAKAYGPFFTPDPIYRVAMTCPDECWRGPMRATLKEISNYETKT